MKKIIYSIAILSLISLTGLQAQNDDNGKGGFGIKGGLTFSTVGLEYEDAMEQKNRFRVGGMAGFGYEFATAGTFAFETDLLYDLRGTKEEISLIGNNEIVQKNYLHYLSIPVNFKFYIGDNFNIHFGPYVAALMGGKTKYQLIDGNGEVLETRNFKITGEEAQDNAGNDYVRRFDAGLQAGLEFVSDGGIGIGTNFSKGVVDITYDEHALGKNNATTTEINLYLIFRL